MKSAAGLGKIAGGILVFFASLVHSGEEVDIQGYVTGHTGGPLENVLVYLKNNDHISAITDSTGYYTLSGTTPIIGEEGRGVADEVGVSMRPGAIIVDLPRAQRISLEVFSLQGRLVYSHDAGVLPQGTQRIDMSEIPAQGMYMLRLTTPNFRVLYRYRPSMMQAVGTHYSDISTASAAPSPFSAAVDTLVVAAEGYELQTLPLTDFSDSANDFYLENVQKQYDLTAYALKDNQSSHPAAADIYGDTLVIGMQRLDGWTPEKPSLLAAIDLRSGEVVEEIETTYGNISAMMINGDYAYVSNPGSHMADGDGGLERIDLTNFTSSVVLDGLSVDPVDMAWLGDGMLAVAAANTDWENPRYSVFIVDGSGENGSVDTVLLEQPGNFHCLAYNEDEDRLYVSDDSDITVYTGNGEVEQTISTTLPVTSMVFDGETLITVESDYESGVYGIISNGSYTQKEVIHQDARVVLAYNQVFIMERYGRDNIIRLDEEYDIAYQKSLGDDINIYDLAVSQGNYGYITAYETGEVFIFDPETGEVPAK
ncbi:MAG: hypothetical protein ACQEQ4_05505 [Fibrobacterota bacterium]